MVIIESLALHGSADDNIILFEQKKHFGLIHYKLLMKTEFKISFLFIQNGAKET